MMVLIVRCNNSLVTDVYLEMIGDVLNEHGHAITYVQNVTLVYSYPKDQIIVVARLLDAMKLILHGYKHIIMWFQGVEPEESYMIHQNKIRLYVLNFIEKVVIKRIEFAIFVSQSMKNHYEKKYSIKFTEKTSYCMPCMNTKIHPKCFFKDGKYNNPIFTYVGSLAPWQKFEETVSLYHKIENLLCFTSKLKVFTQEKESAKLILDKYNIKNYSIDFVENDSLCYALADVKYGFVIREDNIVNKVSTPTKLSTYLSCGIIPIYSKCIEDFSLIATNMNFAIPCDNTCLVQLNRMENQEIDCKDVLHEYIELFDTYYNMEKHKKQLYKCFNMLYKRK